MGRKTSSVRGSSRPRSSAFAQGQNRGVVPVRRKIARQSIPDLLDYSESLESVLDGKARMMTPNSLHVSVVSFSRLSESHKRRGQPTSEIARKFVQLSSRPVEATIGKIMLAGGGNKYKLAIELQSEQLLEEEAAYSQALSDLRFPLLKEYTSEDGQYHPHCSVALLYNDHLKEFENPDRRAYLDEMAHSIGKTILLNPPEFR